MCIRDRGYLARNVFGEEPLKSISQEVPSGLLRPKCGWLRKLPAINLLAVISLCRQFWRERVTMKAGEKTPALRAIMEQAPCVAKPRIWCGKKLPTEKQLRES